MHDLSANLRKDMTSSGWNRNAPTSIIRSRSGSSRREIERICRKTTATDGRPKKRNGFGT
jgi:hypothetical protein